MMDNEQLQPSRPPAPDCGGFDIRITSDGAWHYRGSPIGRMALVRLFASVLKRDPAGDYWLETPVERGRIQVDDAPFVAVELSVEGAGHAQRLQFRTNIDETVTADQQHRIHVRSGNGRDGGEGRPYLHLRDGIEALIARPVFYSLVDLAEERTVAGRPQLGVWSSGAFFPLAPAEPVPSGARQADVP